MAWNPDIQLISGEIYRQYLKQAYAYAWKHSADPVTKTGALLVSANLEEILAFGANHFTKGVIPSKEQAEDKKWKYEHIIHAEPAAIYSAARTGNATESAVMFMPWVPCTPCAKSIIDSGIKSLIGHKEMIMKTPERWWESTDYAIHLLKKAGVDFFMYSGEIGEVQSLFDGAVWKP